MHEVSGYLSQPVNLAKEQSGQDYRAQKETAEVKDNYRDDNCQPDELWLADARA